MEDVTGNLCAVLQEIIKSAQSREQRLAVAAWEQMELPAKESGV
jgi:hypothetical protein